MDRDAELAAFEPVNHLDCVVFIKEAQRADGSESHGEIEGKRRT